MGRVPMLWQFGKPCGLARRVGAAGLPCIAMATAKAKAKQPPAKPRPRFGVYLDQHRYSAVLIHLHEQGVHYLTLVTGKVTVEFHSDEKFLHDFPLILSEYPIRRAIRLYNESGLERDERTQKILDRLLARL